MTSLSATALGGVSQLLLTMIMLYELRFAVTKDMFRALDCSAACRALSIRLPSIATMQMLKAMMELNGEASCKRLSQLYGGTTSYYIACTMNLGRRVKKYFNLPACMDGDQERYFPNLFLGKNMVEDGVKNYCYKIRPELYEALQEIDLSHISAKYEEDEEVSESTQKTDVNKNTILYGPPGTGKTYNTVVYAVAIIENKLLADVKNESYSDVLERYNAYKAEGLIEFTTFHQSYGYEEFIEGIKPSVIETNGSKDICYDVQAGVFKKFCEQTDENRTLFRKISDQHYKDAKENCQEYSVGEFNFIIPDNSDDNDTWFDDADIYAQWCNPLTGDTSHLPDIEQKKVNAINAILDKMIVDYGLPEKMRPQRNHVFVIDEINRGNISKIFGELITLIESSKRIGQPEGMRAKLPYSQQLFGVPDNIYIIGTMNTADRSIATIDTALRRRFRFKEMMPDADVLKGISVEDISVSEMLARMNKRICVLYDREHTIGHAYFIPLRDKLYFRQTVKSIH